LRTEHIWLDDNRNVVSSDKATYVSINKYDDNGVLIEELFGKVERP